MSLLACGLDPSADKITLEAFQQHLLRELHDTGYEPAFALTEIEERPLVATINFAAPAGAGTTDHRAGRPLLRGGILPHARSGLRTRTRSGVF